jgi:Kef-type K+ transport system membrane component KefB
MDHSQHAATLVSLVLVFVPAKLLGAVFERLRLPGLVGEILAGVLIAVNLAGDLINVALGTEPRALIGVPVAVLILLFLCSARVRRFFNAAGAPWW